MDFFKGTFIDVFAHVCAWENILILVVGCLKVIPLKCFHSSSALSLSKGSRHEVQHLEMPNRVPPKNKSLQSDMVFMFLISFRSHQSRVQDWGMKSGCAQGRKNISLADNKSVRQHWG